MGRTLLKILSLNERLNRLGSKLYESGKQRVQITRDQLVDAIDSLADNPENRGRFASITYVRMADVYKTRARVDMSNVNKVLDDTNDEYGNEQWHSSLRDFAKEDGPQHNPVKLIVAVTRYVFNWHGRKKYADDYDNYVNRKQHAYSDYYNSHGYDINKDRLEKGAAYQTNKTNHAFNTTENGTNILRFNMAKANIKNTFYLVDETGHIISEIPENVVDSLGSERNKNYIDKAYRGIMTPEEEAEFNEILKNLKRTVFNTVTIDLEKMLCLVMTDGDESYYYINDKLNSPVGNGTNSLINQQEMKEIAEKQLNLSFNDVDNYAMNNH